MQRVCKRYAGPDSNIKVSISRNSLAVFIKCVIFNINSQKNYRKISGTLSNIYLYRIKDFN